jgi:hypothetical protein
MMKMTGILERLLGTQIVVNVAAGIRNGRLPECIER